ncbi:DUF397 domain-containing protein [Actinophytocola sediminis]
MTTSNDFAGARWRKSSRSTDTGDCVELAHTDAAFGVRDSKNASAAVLALTAQHGLAFLGAIKSDRLTRS